MCGIAGILDHHADAPLRTQLEGMLAWMLKRGPDGSGEFVEGPLAMGMRRLAVIDLEGGWQPLYAADGQVVVFQNGEIYNVCSGNEVSMSSVVEELIQSAGVSVMVGQDEQLLRKTEQRRTCGSSVRQPG